MKAPKLDGILKTALFVENVNLSLLFYQKIFEFETLFFDEQIGALNVSDQQVLLLFLKRSSKLRSTTSGDEENLIDWYSEDLHLAFSIAANELEQWKGWLNKNNIAIEKELKWKRGGTSIYFRDPDNYLLELETPGIWTIY